MQTPEQKSLTTVVYRSGTSQALGAGWDVMQVLYQEQGVTRNSLVIARDASGAIIRKTDSFPERWEPVSDPETLRAYHEWFDNRDRLLAEKAAGAGSNAEQPSDPEEN